MCTIFNLLKSKLKNYKKKYILKKKDNEKMLKKIHSQITLNKKVLIFSLLFSFRIIYTVICFLLNYAKVKMILFGVRKL